MNEDVVEILVELPSGTSLKVPIDSQRYHSDYRLDEHMGESHDYRLLLYTMEYVLENPELHDAKDVFILEQFGLHPSRIPVIISELL
jgi:hypothetical protein